MGKYEILLGKVMVLSLLMLECIVLTEGSNYRVGDRVGWTFNVVAWPLGKTFKAGDTLLFRYNPIFHNMIPVDRFAYLTCITPRGSKVYRSGSETVKLVRGTTYFICGVPGHCLGGMKIAVTAT